MQQQEQEGKLHDEHSRKGSAGGAAAAAAAAPAPAAVAGRNARITGRSAGRLALASPPRVPSTSASAATPKPSLLAAAVREHATPQASSHYLHVDRDALFKRVNDLMMAAMEGATSSSSSSSSSAGSSARHLPSPFAAGLRSAPPVQSWGGIKATILSPSSLAAFVTPASTPVHGGGGGAGSEGGAPAFARSPPPPPMPHSPQASAWPLAYARPTPSADGIRTYGM